MNTKTNTNAEPIYECQMEVMAIVIMTTLNASTGKLLTVTTQHKQDHNSSLSPLVKYFLLTVPMRCFFCGSFLLSMFRVCHTFLSVHHRPLGSLVCKVSCVFVTFPCDVLGQV